MLLIKCEGEEIKVDGLGVSCSALGENRNACCILVGKSEGMISHG